MYLLECRPALPGSEQKRPISPYTFPMNQPKIVTPRGRFIPALAGATISPSPHLHPSDRFNLDQDYTFDTKLTALQKGQDLLEQWLLELDDC